LNLAVGVAHALRTKTAIIITDITANSFFDIASPPTEILN